MVNISQTDLAWLAGLLEGEGYFGIDNRSANRYETSTTPAKPFIKLAMTDQDIVEKVSTMIGKRYFIAGRPTAAGKTVYILHIGARETVKPILLGILPYMGQRRSERINQCLKLIEQWEDWNESGGRSKMAKIGYEAKLLKASKSKDMMSY